MNLFKLVGSIFIDNEKANDSISKTDSKAGELAKKFADGVVKAAKWGAGVTTAAVGMATATGAAISKIADETREYRNEIGKLDTAFEASNFTAETARNTYKSLQSILGETDQAVEAANHLAKLCTTQEELAKWTDICTGVYATFGASLPIEGLTEAANETAKTGSITGGLADALNWAGVSEEAFQEKLEACTNEQERQALITETLGGLYTDVAEAYRKNNEEVIKANAAQERWNATLAKVGEKVEPIVTDFKEFGATLLEAALPALEAITEEGGLVTTAMEFLKDVLVILTEVIGGTVKFTNNLIDTWMNSKEWAEENAGAIKTLVSVFGLLTTAVLAYNSAKIVKKALDIAETAQIYLMIAAENAHTIATTVATGATTAFGAAIAFLTSPITLVIAAIGALIAVGVALYKNWDDVSAKCSKVWNSMKDSISRAMEVAKKNVKEAIDKIKGFFDFKWELPKIELPHFTIKGKFSLDPPSIPKIGVSWYKKAMDEPMILKKPTIFGYSNASDKYLGGGEAGDEVVSGKETLLDMIRTAITEHDNLLINALQTLQGIVSEIYDLLQGKEETTGDIVIPIYFGNEMIDEMIVDSRKRVVLRSGGMANV